MQIRRKKRRFTESEDDYIRGNYGTMTGVEIAFALGRSPKSVQCRWKRLGLALTPKQRSARRRATALRVLTQTRCPEATRRKKLAANGLINMRLRRGAIEKPNRCETCDRVRRLDAHHDDYDKPAEVRWLCRSCHMKWHRAND